jgi:eukaryotic-like serine/threonine-protein kinase
MAEVFKAKSYGVEGFEKIIAIKRILPSMGEDREFIKMFIDEAKIAGQLAHANICQIFELGRIDGAHFIAMEYIWGKDLLQLQNRQRKANKAMEPAMASHIMAKVCEGLDHAHKKRDPMGGHMEIVHRDCSPQNVLVSYEGEVKIIDFGIAKATSRSSRTMAGVLKGKFGYMSPEQVRGLPLDRRSDIFSLGTVFYESLTGAKLFQGESDFSTLERVRNVDVEPPRKVNANIPPEVEAIVMKALEGDPDKRYQWCSEMQADLQRFLMSQDPVFTAKTLSAWMKQHFQVELNRERQLMESYKTVGRDGKQVGLLGRPAPGRPALGTPALAPPDLGPPDLDLEDDLTEARADDESESTMMGGPDFGGILASKRQDGDTGDFGDEAPTEIFGDIDTNDVGPQGMDLSQGLPPETLAGVTDDDSASARTILDSSGLEELRQQILDQPGGAMPPPAPPPGVPPVPQPGLAGMGAASAPTMMPQTMGPPAMPAGFDMQQQQQQQPFMQQQQQQFGQGYYQPASGQQYAQPAGVGMEMFGATSTVAPLSASDAGPGSGNKRRRSSLFKDIAIGVSIAVVVLGLFAGGKLFFKGESKAADAEPAKGTIAITVNGDEPADVFVDGQKKGTAQADKPLQLDLALGSHAIRVMRQDAKEPCERVVQVTDVNVDQQVECTLESRGPPTGTLVLENLTSEHEVLVDGQRLADDKKTQPLELGADTAHQIVVKKGNDLINSFTVTVAAGQEERRDITKAEVKKDEVKKDEVKKDEVKKDEVKKDEVKKDVTSTKPRPKDTTPPKETGPPGYLVINTDPPNARVFVGRKDTQKNTPISPRNRIELPPGHHRVRLVLGSKKHHVDVTIKSGEMTRIDKKLE